MKERIGFLDYAKFFGLCLVVYGHIPPTDNLTHTIIYSFHIPFFFFVSGMLFSPEKYSIKKNISSLLVPYFAFSFLIVVLRAVISFILNHHFQLYAFITDFLSVLIGSSDTHCPFILVSGPAWFLLALFVVKLNAWGLLKLKTVSMIVVVAVEIIAILFLRSIFDWFVFSLDGAVLGLPFFLVGYYMRDVVLTYSQREQRFLLGLVLMAIMCLCPFNGQVDMFSGDYGKSFILFILFGITGSLLLLIISSIVNNHCPIITLMVRGAPFIICTHLFVLDYLYLAYRLLLGQLLIAPAPFVWYEKLMFTVISLAISYSCIIVIDKKAPFLLGR